MRDVYRRGGKRACDVALASLALVMLAPVMAIVAVVVWLALGRPILFRQVRVGLRGRTFTLIKFRTMSTATDSGRTLLPDAEWLTPVGSVLRRLSLDELPQFVNVLRGHMSLVGPRPLLPKYLPRYTPEQSRRHEVKPGITGLAQVSGRNTLSWEERFDLDVRYVREACFALDARILGRTILLAIRGTGATPHDRATMPEFRGTPTTR
jgi:sugar transferase EpsL